MVCLPYNKPAMVHGIFVNVAVSNGIIADNGWTIIEVTNSLPQVVNLLSVLSQLTKPKKKTD